MNLFWLILSIALWGLLHTLFASLRFKAFTRRMLGPTTDHVYRLCYNVFAGFSLLPVLALAALQPDRSLYTVRLPWSLLMYAGELLALLTLAFGFLQSHPLEFLGLQQLASTTSETGGLITTGLYRYVRHPLYSAGLVLIWLVPRMSVNVLVMDLGLSAYILIGASFEERKLRKEFGQAYTDYISETPMLVPFLKGNKSRGGTS
jgi:methanethiol S-methyltransferase